MAEDKSRFTTHDKRLTRLDLMAGEIRNGHFEHSGDFRAVLMAVLVETVMLGRLESLLHAVENRCLDFDWFVENARPGEKT